MVDLSDWKPSGQEHLKGKTLFFKHYSESKYPDWDHDHCEFCGIEFSIKYSGTLREGYCTEDTYYWICPQCFEDFKEMFMFKVDNPPK